MVPARVSTVVPLRLLRFLAAEDGRPRLGLGTQAAMRIVDDSGDPPIARFPYVYVLAAAEEPVNTRDPQHNRPSSIPPTRQTGRNVNWIQETSFDFSIE